MRFTLISDQDTPDPRTRFELTFCRLHGARDRLATQEACKTRPERPVSSFAGRGRLGPGLVGVHKIARERGYLLPLQPSYSCQQANSALTSSAAGFQGRASHIDDVKQESLSLPQKADIAAKLH